MVEMGWNGEMCPQAVSQRVFLEEKKGSLGCDRSCRRTSDICVSVVPFLTVIKKSHVDSLCEWWSDYSFRNASSTVIEENNSTGVPARKAAGGGICENNRCRSASVWCHVFSFFLNSKKKKSFLCCSQITPCWLKTSIVQEKVQRVQGKIILVDRNQC